MSSEATEHAEALHDLGNELALLHQALWDFRAYGAHGIHSGDYYSELHQRVARAIEATQEEYGQTDVQLGHVVTFGLDCKLITPDDRDYILERLQDPPLGVVADARKLKRQRRERDLFVTLSRAARAVAGGRADEALAMVAVASEEAAEELDTSVRLLDAEQLIARWLERQDQRATSGGISLGLSKLKQHIGQLNPGSMVVIGAHTGNGKSSLVNEILCAAADDGTHGAVISMEDDDEVATTRWISAFAGLPPKAFQAGGSREAAMRGIARFRQYQGKLYFYDCLGGNEQDVMAAMTVAARRGVRLVVVDYIGEVGASISQQDRRNEVRWLVTRLKAHARRLGVALILVSQFSRPKDGNMHKEPTKHDLKEAGDVENAAEYVVLLWREAEHDYAPMHVKLAKAKTGGTNNRWLMQREVFTTDVQGCRRQGSARLREVVAERRHPGDYDYPELRTDYEAILEELVRNR